jgi:hypothetical protein
MVFEILNNDVYLIVIDRRIVVSETRRMAINWIELQMESRGRELPESFFYSIEQQWNGGSKPRDLERLEGGETAPPPRRPQ